MTLGYFKFRVMRLQTYFSIVSSATTLLASFKILGLSYFWLLLAVPGLYLLHRFDKKRIHPTESATMFADNLEWQEMRMTLRRIEQQVEELHDKN